MQHNSCISHSNNKLIIQKRAIKINLIICIVIQFILMVSVKMHAVPLGRLNVHNTDVECSFNEAPGLRYSGCNNLLVEIDFHLQVACSGALLTDDICVRFDNEFIPGGG
jgi:hypothetical protein